MNKDGVKGMDTPITRAEHEEFRRTMDSEHKRISRRMDVLEEETKQIRKLASSVERLAVSMENMNGSLAEQGAKLEKLEERDGELWRKVTGYVITTVIGLILGFVFRHIGM